MNQTIYLDNAAATPVDPVVLAQMQPYYQDQFYNPSALYLSAKAVSHDIATARELVAKQLDARSAEITFTAGGTEANNLAIHGVMQQFPNSNLIVSAIEHDSVLAPAAQYDCRVVPVNDRAQIDLAHLSKSIDENTVLVSIMYANNEVGAIQPISRISQVVQATRDKRIAAGNNTPLYLHTDACQAANYLSLNKSRLGVDLMTLNGGKVYGPKQSGCLFVRAGTELIPQIAGGGQERGLRSGTENVAQTIGFAHALAAAQSIRQFEFDRLHKLREEFCARIASHAPAAVITPSAKTGVLPNFVHLQLPGTDNERIIMELDERGIMAAAGSACSASSDEPSHVLMAMGFTTQAAQSSIRFTMGRHTTQQDIQRVVEVLSGLVG